MGMTQERILQIQAQAVETSDYDLLCLTYTALGYDRRIAFQSVAAGERARAVKQLTDRYPIVT